MFAENVSDSVAENALLGAYHGLDMTMEEIGEKFDRTEGSVSYHMDKYDISQNPLDLVSDSYLESLHWNENMTKQEIANLFQTSKTTVHRYFERNDIDSKSLREAKYSQNIHPSVRNSSRGYVIASARTPDGNRKQFYVHRLVAFAHFDGDMDDFCDLQVHHRNKYKWDNRPRNLEPLSEVQHQAVHHMDEWTVDSDGEPVLLSPKYAEENQ
jgi:predicted DNA-binding protein YlxM (UPF0122 family)